MSDWNVYCAICGGPFGDINWDHLDSNADIYYDPEVLSGPRDPELGWLGEFNLIGGKFEAETSSRIWVSGPATGIDENFVYYEAGDDPAPVNMPNSGSIRVYSRDARFWSAPFHTRCYRILCQYMGINELKKDIFFATLRSMAGDSDSSLDLDYGDIDGKMCSTWSTLRDEEYFVFNPVEVKGLSEFYNNLPQRRMNSLGTTNVFNTMGDPFVKVPFDILLLIISYFKSIDTIYKLRRASPAVANLPLGNGFWMKRLKDDMPWLWDLPTLPSSQLEKVDWKQVYHSLDWGVRKLSVKKNKFHGLCNRKRIWKQMCPDFAETYTRFTVNMKAWGSISPPVLDGASITPPMSISPSSGWDESSTTDTLLDLFSDLPTTQPRLAVSWSDEILQDIQILRDRNPTNSTSAVLESYRTEIICVPDADWITGFITTSHQIENDETCVVGLDILFAKKAPVKLGSNLGDKFLLHVEPDHFMVALKLAYTEDGILTRMSLVEQALIHARGCDRVIADASEQESGLILSKDGNM